MVMPVLADLWLKPIILVQRLVVIKCCFYTDHINQENSHNGSAMTTALQTLSNTVVPITITWYCTLQLSQQKIIPKINLCLHSFLLHLLTGQMSYLKLIIKISYDIYNTCNLMIFTMQLLQNFHHFSSTYN